MNLKMSIPLAISCAKCKNLEPRESEYTEAEFFCLEKKEFILTPELTTCRQRRTESGNEEEILDETQADYCSLCGMNVSVLGECDCTREEGTEEP